MKFVEFMDHSGVLGAANTDHIMTVGQCTQRPTDHSAITFSDGSSLVVKGHWSDVLAKIDALDQDYEVDEPAEPVVLSLVCKNCHLDQDSHMPNWLGGMNCSVFGDTQTYFEPEIRKA